MGKVTEYKNIVFDLGRVLFDWQPVEILKSLCSEDPHFPRTIIEITMSHAWKNFDRGKATVEDIAVAFSNKYAKETVLRFIKAAIQSFRPLQTGVAIWDDVLNKGYKTYILSNLPIDFQKNITREHPFLSQRNGGIFSCDVGFVKPEPAIYEKLIEAYTLEPGQTIFIDDLEENILMAENFGIKGVVCQNHGQVRNDLCRLGVL